MEEKTIPELSWEKVQHTRKENEEMEGEKDIQITNRLSLD